MEDPMPMILLASRSPRRRELLEQVGIRFRVVEISVDESRFADERPAAFVERLARAKARQGAAEAGHGEIVLGADTTVTLDDDVLGKPDDEAHALAMLGQLSGRTHMVCTAIAVARDERVDSRVVTSRVRLRSIDDVERRAYWASGEPRGKAGAYAIQGLGAVFVEHLEGSYSNVVGLPLFETVQLLRRFGVDTLAANALAGADRP